MDWLFDANGHLCVFTFGSSDLTTYEFLCILWKQTFQVFNKQAINWVSSVVLVQTIMTKYRYDYEDGV